MTVAAKIVFNRFPEIQAAMRPRASLAVRKAAFDIEAKAKAAVAVDTGNLKNSIQAHELGSFSWEVGTSVHYGPYQEYGTSKMAAHPYLIPAAEAVRPSFIQAMEMLIA